jgi:hypothetical protein
MTGTPRRNETDGTGSLSPDNSDHSAVDFPWRSVAFLERGSRKSSDNRATIEQASCPIKVDSVLANVAEPLGLIPFKLHQQPASQV